MDPIQSDTVHGEPYPTQSLSVYLHQNASSDHGLPPSRTWPVCLVLKVSRARDISSLLLRRHAAHIPATRCVTRWPKTGQCGAVRGSQWSATAVPPFRGGHAYRQCAARAILGPDRGVAGREGEGKGKGCGPPPSFLLP